jgi:FkbH-like protein
MKGMTSHLFAEELKRLELLRQAPDPEAEVVRVAVYRNHAFETVASVLDPFLGFSGLRAECEFGGYDDAFGFQNVFEADLNLMWVDAERYREFDLMEWLGERAAALRARSPAPILLLVAGGAGRRGTWEIPDLWDFAVEALVPPGGGEVYDRGREAVTGTRLSGRACLEVARALGLRLMPAVLRPALKAVVLDLDQTLYEGVLGEDGPEGVRLTAAHAELQRHIRALNEEGFLLCLASRNEEEDVRGLFAGRPDFVLGWDDFAAVRINWNPKAENLAELASELNIGADAMLFVDDNPAEIQNVEISGLGVRTLLARNPADTLRRLRYYPGLLKLRKSSEDAVRAADIRANRERKALVETLAPRDYFARLQIKLAFAVDEEARIARVAELSGKTNQFILGYRRYTETEVRRLMQAPDGCVVTACMSDLLSDSGMIAFVAARAEGERLVCEELVVSCRALGRNLEDVMLSEMMRLAAARLGTRGEALIGYRKGERNGPALGWLRGLTGDPLEAGEGQVSWAVPEKVDLEGLEIEVRQWAKG